MTTADATVRGSLSPSRAAEFKSCPLMYRLRNIDRVPAPPSSVAVRGTVVHAALEALFDLPPAARTLPAAVDLLPGAWHRVLAEEPEVAALFAADTDGAALQDWLASAADLLARYFTLEDPASVDAEALEQQVEHVVGDVRLRGCLDRLDHTADGGLRVVDYKTGFSPGVQYEMRAMFQLKFYALMVWRIRGVVPGELRLMYFGDSETLTYHPDADELERFERTVLAIWAAIRDALRTHDFRPSPGRSCDWCDYHALCPVFGGTPPPFPEVAVVTDPRDDPVSRPG